MAFAVAVLEVAVMVAEPADATATNPTDETVATVVADEDQATVSAASELPPASAAVAVSVSVSPMMLNVSESLESSRITATWATVAVAVPLADPDVAVIVAEPLVTAVTRPEEDTVAMDADDELHDTLALLIARPFWSLTVAESCVVWPSAPRLTLAGDIVIDVATGGGGGGGVVGVLSPPHARSRRTQVSLMWRIRRRYTPVLHPHQRGDPPVSVPTEAGLLAHLPTVFCAS